MGLTVVEQDCTIAVLIVILDKKHPLNHLVQIIWRPLLTQITLDEYPETQALHGIGRKQVILISALFLRTPQALPNESLLPPSEELLLPGASSGEGPYTLISH